MRLKQYRLIRSFALTATAAMSAMAVTMAFGAGVSFAKEETKEATYYEDSENNLCVGLPTGLLFAGSCEWAKMTGSDNVGVGFGVLKSDTTGEDNTASGHEALVKNKTGKNNTANGFRALALNTEGFDNTASGFSALFANLTGTLNTASGIDALASNTEGGANTAIGSVALLENTTGFRNVGIGASAGRNLTTGSNNIDIANTGEAGESETTRIGTEGKQTKAFVAGVQTPVEGCTVQVTTAGQLGCNSAAGATGATGPIGATGPTGPEGKVGSTGATGPTGVGGGGASFEFSSGGKNLANKEFIGLGSVNSSEGVVQQSVAPSGTLTKMTCFQNGTSSSALTYTLRKNGASTTLTCSIAAGKRTGAGSGSVAFASGDLLDVKAPERATPEQQGSFSVSTG